MDKTEPFMPTLNRDIEADLAQATKDKYKKIPVFLGVVGRFPRAMREIAKVSVFGAKKHQVAMGDMGYLDVPDAGNLYREAEARHMIAEQIEGPINHADGALYHKAQKAWNALADLETYLRDYCGEPNEVR